LKIVNPNFVIKNSLDIFKIREQEYLELKDKIREMLRPVEDSGFVIKEFEIKDLRPSTDELEKTLKKSIVILLGKGNHDFDLSMAIPKLVDGNYIKVSGKKKVPIFQLFDIPIVTRGADIKLRTNVGTIMVSHRKEPDSTFVDYVYVTILGKKIPFAILLFAYYGYEEIEKRFELDKIEAPIITDSSSIADKLLYDLKVYHESSVGYSKEDFITDVGKNYSTIDPLTRGEKIIYSLDLLPRIDLMSSQFFHKDSVIEELLYAISNPVDDKDYRNKRIRCFEYVVLSKIAKNLFNLCLACFKSSSPKFNVNSKQIIQDCNVSNIIQFDFSINPIDELSKLTRISLVGPDGFTKENVPVHLRDLWPSMFGRICPVDTPDRENCGVLQNLLVNTKLDPNLRFSEELEEKSTISIPVSMVPFSEHDDQTRLQMASSQMRQAIMLEKPELPLVESGCERLYTDKTQFIKVARKDGQVIFLNDEFLVLLYDDKDYDTFDISIRNTHVENIDYMTSYVKLGERVKAGQILAESNFCENGQIKFGRNYLTAVMPYHGLNYEDSIIISERVQEQMFTSVHFVDLSFEIPPNKVLLDLSVDRKKYTPLPILDREDNKNERVKLAAIQENIPYAVMKEIPDGPVNFSSIFEEETKHSFNKPAYVFHLKVYPNNWNRSIPEYNKWVEQIKEKQLEEEKKIEETLLEHLPPEDVKKFLKENNLNMFSKTEKGRKYKIKGEEVKGVYVEMYGIYMRKIEVGDKIGNRHGNKGVVKILPKEKMPRMEDGKYVDICISPLSVISRMNLGQIFELHLGMSLVDLKRQLVTMLTEEKTQEELKKYILDYIKIIDNTEDNWYYKQFEEQLNKTTVDETFIYKLSVVEPPFESTTAEMVLKALEYTNTPSEYKMFDSISNRWVLNPIAVGYMYFFKMIHIAETKLAGRGIGVYNKRTLQPLGGRKNRGGQRCGEMETACLIAHGSTYNLHEFLTTKSDCTDLKNDYIRSVVESEFIRKPETLDKVPESVKLFDKYLQVIGLDSKD